MRKLQTMNIDLNEVQCLTIEQAKARYSIGANSLYKIADEAEANIRIGTRKRLFAREKLDKYFSSLHE